MHTATNWDPFTINIIHIFELIILQEQQTLPQSNDNQQSYKNQLRRTNGKQRKTLFTGDFYLVLDSKKKKGGKKGAHSPAQITINY